MVIAAIEAANGIRRSNEKNNCSTAIYSRLHIFSRVSYHKSHASISNVHAFITRCNVPSFGLTMHLSTTAMPKRLTTRIRPFRRIHDARAGLRPCFGRIGVISRGMKKGGGAITSLSFVEQVCVGNNNTPFHGDCSVQPSNDPLGCTTRRLLGSGCRERGRVVATVNFV